MNKVDFSEITFPKSLNITEQNIDISNLTDVQKDYYINILKEIIDIYTNKNERRIVIGFAGPSGSGKSVMVEILKEISSQITLPFKIETLGIDAYSYTNEFLVNHYDDNKTFKDYKGRFDTYDVYKLINDLKSFKEGKGITLPIYSRKIHNPIENAITIKAENVVLLVEGLWLLHEENKWNEVGEILDFSYFVSIDKEKAGGGTIKRHILGGRDVLDATNYYKEVDSKNFDLIIKNKDKAEKIIPTYCDL